MQGPNVDSLDVRGVGCLAVGHHALKYCISSEQAFRRLGDSIAAAVAGVSGTLTRLRFEGCACQHTCAFNRHHCPLLAGSFKNYKPIFKPITIA